MDPNVTFTMDRRVNSVYCSPTRTGMLCKSSLVLILVLASCFVTIVSSASSHNYSKENLKAIFISVLTSSLSSASVGVSNGPTTFAALVSKLSPDGSPSHSPLSGVDGRCLRNVSVPMGSAANCIASMRKCISLDEVGNLYSLDPSSTLTPAETEALTPALLCHLVSCNGIRDHEEVDNTENPSASASWGYGFLFVTVINLCCLTGALVLPCMNYRYYKVVLMFLVALAVGTLAGSGLLILIPETLELREHGGDYVWKTTTVMGGIYLFYLVEKLLRTVNDRRENTQSKKQQDKLATEGQFTSSFTRKPIDNAIGNIGGGGICSPSTTSDVGNGKGMLGQTHSLISSSAANTPNSNHNCKEANRKEGHGVASVAYMIIFGDALHNFIDGLSIGSAFTKSTVTGISVSVAVMCEELPHELGDFALLLNSGMPIRKALGYNFLSSCTCYMGLVVGIMLGEDTQSQVWIFALAGGVFLYISLVDMLPEMNAAAESVDGKRLGTLSIFIIHNLGLLTGFLIMLVCAVFGENINLNRHRKMTVIQIVIVAPVLSHSSSFDGVEI